MKGMEQFIGTIVMLIMLGATLAYVGVDAATSGVFFVFAVGMIVFSFVYKDSYKNKSTSAPPRARSRSRPRNIVER